MESGGSDSLILSTLSTLAKNGTPANVTELTMAQQLQKRLKNLIIDDDGSFLYIPFIGSIYLAIVFIVLAVTFCRHFAKVGDQRIRWIRHSSNSTCLTGPGTMTVICSNWVYLCRQHGHFGLSAKHTKPVTEQQLKKLKVTAKKAKTETSVEDDTAHRMSPSAIEEGATGDDPPIITSALPERKAGSSCFPWTSYPTPTGLVSYRELAEPNSLVRPETPSQFYCVSGRHTPADEQIEFWHYTPELERKGIIEALNKMSEGGPGGSAGSGVTRTTNVSFAPDLTTNPPSSPSSPSLLPRPSLATPNLSVLARTHTTTPTSGRRSFSKRRQSSLKVTNKDYEAQWNAMMAEIIQKSKESNEQYEAGDVTPRERSGSTGSKSESLEMQRLRSYSPATQRKRELAAQAAAAGISGPSRPVRNVSGGDDEGGARRGGGILAITRIGRDIRDKRLG